LSQAFFISEKEERAKSEVQSGAGGGGRKRGRKRETFHRFQKLLSPYQYPIMSILRLKIFYQKL
jgi:hypothetical protein